MATFVPSSGRASRLGTVTKIPHGPIGSSALAKASLWLGLLFPLAYAPVRTQAEILQSGLTKVSLLRGLVPVIALIVAFALVPRRGRLTRLEFLVVAFVGVCLLSTFWSPVPWATALKAASLASAYAIIFLLVRLHEQRKEDSLDGLNIFIAVVVLASLAGAVLAPDQAWVVLSKFDPARRLAGVLPGVHPDYLGLYAAVGTVLLIARWDRIKGSRRVLTLAPIPVYLGVLVLTRTRTAWLILIVMLISLAITSPTLRRPIAVSLVCVSVVAAGLLAYPGTQSKAFKLLGRQQSVQSLFTLTGRTQVWRLSLEKWSSRPLTGFGYYAGHRFVLSLPRGSEEISDVDNMWVEALLDVGLLGLVPLGLVVAYGAISLARRQANEDFTLPVRRALFVGAFVSALVNPSLELYSYGMVLFAIVILGAPRLGIPRPIEIDNERARMMTTSQIARRHLTKPVQ